MNNRRNPPSDTFIAGGGPAKRAPPVPTWALTLPGTAPAVAFILKSLLRGPPAPVQKAFPQFPREKYRTRHTKPAGQIRHEFYGTWFAEDRNSLQLIGVIAWTDTAEVHRERDVVPCLPDHRENVRIPGTVGIAERIHWLAQEIFQYPLRADYFVLHLCHGERGEVSMGMSVAADGIPEFREVSESMTIQNRLVTDLFAQVA